MLGALYGCSSYLNNVNWKLTCNAYIVPNLTYLIINWETCDSTNFQNVQTI